MRLRIESAGGSPVNEYRIKDGSVQFRALDSEGRPYPGRASAWKILNDNAIEFHHVLGTVVSKWLCVRLGASGEGVTPDKAA